MATGKTKPKTGLCSKVGRTFVFSVMFVLAVGSISFFTDEGTDGAESLSSTGLVISNNGKEVVSCPASYSGTLSIPNSVEKINDYAFYGCVGVTGEIYIPASVSDIGAGAFAGCGGSCFNVDKNNQTYSSVNGLLATKDGKKIIACPAGMTGNIVISDDVTEIGFLAFCNCTGLNGSLVIGKNVQKIGDYAFAGCVNILFVDFRCSDAVIGTEAFKGITFTDSDGIALEHTSNNLCGSYFGGPDSILVKDVKYPVETEPDHTGSMIALVVGMIVFPGYILYKFKDKLF